MKWTLKREKMKWRLCDVSLTKSCWIILLLPAFLFSESERFHQRGENMFSIFTLLFAKSIPISVNEIGNPCRVYYVCRRFLREFSTAAAVDAMTIDFPPRSTYQASDVIPSGLF